MEQMKQKDNLQNETKTTKEKVIKVLSIAFNVVFYIFIFGLLFIAISSINTKKTGVPNVFGTGIFSVQSESMVGDNEDSFNKGDLIIIKLINEKNINDLEIGDIVTFRDPSLYNELNTHRIVDIIYNEDNTIKTVITQGDGIKGKAPDDVYVKGVTTPETGRQIQVIAAERVVAVYKSQIKGLGKTIDYLQTSVGFGLCIVLPTAILLIIEAVFLVKNILAVNKEKMQTEQASRDEKVKLDLEEEKKRMREELLAELKKEQENKEEK